MSAQSQRDIARWNGQAAQYGVKEGMPDQRLWDMFSDTFWDSLGDIKDLKIWDVGCGHGWLTQQMQEKGAHVQGVDGSQDLIDIAQERYPNIEFITHDLVEGLPTTDQLFDRIVANMVLMDIPDIQALMRDIALTLKSDGRFLFTMTHPAFFNYETQQDNSTGSFYKKITGYLRADTWDIGHSHYHRSLSCYIEQLRINRLAVTRFYEPKHIPLSHHPPEKYAFFQDIPIFIFFEARPVLDQR